MINNFLKVMTLALSFGTILLLCSGCDQEHSPQTVGEAQESTVSISNKCRLTYGLNSEEVALNDDEQANLIDVILSHPMQETTPEELESNEVLYGGSVFCLEYCKGDTRYKWNFNANVFSKTVILNDTVVEKCLYQADQTLLNKLKKYI